MYVNYNKFTTHTKESILDSLATDDAWVERALVVLYDRQTSSEQYVKQSVHNNEIGFQPADARFFTRYAEKINSGKHLTREELAYCRRPWKRGKRVIQAIAKYRGQILEIIEAKARAKALAARAQ